MTALFISVFLFFLSVALIWTNRQDIALSLSMEHKLKAQSAARSAAAEAYARLRQLGSLEGFNGGDYNGATAQIELVSLPPKGRRGEVLLLRAKGTSGPLNSYYTMHLLDTRIAGEENKDDRRVLFFPSGASSSAGSGESGGEGGATAQSGGGQALFGTFTLENGGAGVVKDMVANAGPVFVSRDLIPSPSEIAGGSNAAAPPSPPYFSDYAPVFSEDGQNIFAWGPSYIVAPPFAGKPKTATSLQYLKYSNKTFEWVNIEPPTDLGDEDAMIEQPSGVLEMTAPPKWSEAKVRGIGDKVHNLAWNAAKPETTSEGDIIGGPSFGASTEASGLKDWSTASGALRVQQKFVTRGAVAAWGTTVYSHGWHYVYRHYTGSAPGGEIDAIRGSTLTRWPCILKYTIDGKWSVYWSPLDESGSVRSELKPDPDILIALDADKLASVTEVEDNSDEQRKLLTFTGNTNPTEGNIVPDGTMFGYKGAPHLVPAIPEKPGLLNLESHEVIDFSTLPDYLPELYGEIVDTSGKEQLIIGMEGGYQGEALDTSLRRTVTARPRYDFSYQATPDRPIAVDGDDLWLHLDVTSSMLEPSHDAAYKNPPFSDGTSTLLARYDGVRWHIFPNGMRAALKKPAGAPGQGVIAALYSDLPKQMNRYAVISISTAPFRMGQ